MKLLRQKFRGNLIPVLLIAALASLLALAGCDQSETADEETSEEPGLSTVELSVKNLEPLEEGDYEGWVITGDEKISFGKFNVDDTSEFVDMNGKTIDEFETGAEVETADAFAISIEPDDDSDEGPSKSLILFGEANDNKAKLEFDAVDFEKLEGQFILGTPTNDPAEQETAGIWFLDPADKSASLKLPKAPAGWVYEGWVVYKGESPLITGRFTSPEDADRFDGYSSKESPAPDFPGEDFIQNLPNGLAEPLLIDGGDSVAVISIESDIDGLDPTGDKPFQLKPLTGKITKDAADHTLFDLTLDQETLPTGTTKLK